MGLPIDLFLVRHAESEGNVAVRQSEGGDTHAFTDAFRSRHSSEWRLTPRGREQAARAGVWLREHIADHFDTYAVSDCLRALETAALLGLPEAAWREDFLLRERDWGIFDTMPDCERREKFTDVFQRRATDPLYWMPPAGESMATVSLRVERFLHNLSGEGVRSAIVVCHGDVMRAFRLRIEHLQRQRFIHLERSGDPLAQIHFCQIIGYSRQHPETKDESPEFTWTCSVNPLDSQPQNTWTHIVQPRSTNAQLLDYVGQTPLLVPDPSPESPVF